jgi:hypothetical protein
MIHYLAILHMAVENAMVVHRIAIMETGTRN